MRYLIIFFVSFIYCCQSSADELKIDKANSSNKQTNNKVKDPAVYFKNPKKDSLIYKAIELSCKQKEFPKECFYKDLKVSFLFGDEPNIINIKANMSQLIHKMPFFEGLDYTSHLFINYSRQILVVELFFEYGRRYLLFEISKSDISFVKEFYIDDLVDDNGEFVKHNLSIESTKEGPVLSIGVHPFMHKEKLKKD